MITESAGGVVLNSKGKVALVYEDDFNGWVIPKGHIKNGETLEQTSKREIFEETGLKNIKLIKFLGIIRRKEYGTGKSKVIHCFLYELQKPDTIKDGAKWFDLKSAKQELFFGEEKAFLNKF